LSILPPLPSLWLRLMCLEPLPRPLLFAGKIGWRLPLCASLRARQLQSN
jgi:hypothetical protein